jgi:hypothetical protein
MFYLYYKENALPLQKSGTNVVSNYNLGIIFIFENSQILVENTLGFTLLSANSIKI